MNNSIPKQKPQQPLRRIRSTHRTMDWETLIDLRRWQENHWRIRKGEASRLATRAELYEMAKHLAIPGRSRMKKAELLKAIRETE